MTAANFSYALAQVLKHEGGYTNEATDAGGPTNYGITIQDARMYWKSDASAEDVRLMPLDVAKRIYRSKYWDRMDCDNLPSGIDYCTFDYGVNSGVGRAIPIYTRFKDLSVADCINSICDERLAFLRIARNRNTGEALWPTYGKGWSRRVADVRSQSLELAGHAPAPIPTPTPTPIPAPEPAPSRRTFWQEVIAAIVSILTQLFRRK